MKRILLTAAIVAMLVSCKAQQTDESDLQKTPPAAAAPSEVPGQQLVSEPTPPVDGVFQTPLPEGVVLTQPHYARMDVTVTNEKGTAGRRTEFEYLDGDAGQAMQAFAASMTVVGFTSDDGPSAEGEVIRQVFGKAGYGSVFARAQPLDPDRMTHDSARGFVVVAWPATIK